MIDAVVTHHTDGFRSGVARFNEILAAKLGVPLLALDQLARTESPLLSFKVREFDEASAGLVEAWLETAGSWEVFLHELDGSPLERRLVDGAARVLCGNERIRDDLRASRPDAVTVWTPGLLLDDRRLPDTELSVFSFGMAHKIRVEMFVRLRDLLERTGKSYAVYVSAANHESASLRDSESVFAEMHEIFPSELFFLGNLSDVAVADYLRRATYYAAFFAGGVRANNTSVASALERGAAVITNLDEWSPKEFVHLDNVIDIAQCEELPVDPAILLRLRSRAVETAGGRSWQELVGRLLR